MPALRPDRRKALLAALRTGLSREAACAKLGIRAGDIDATGKRCAEQVSEAEAAGDALIEATLLERGMAGDTQALKMALERRRRPVESDLGADIASLTPAERDAVRRLVESAKLTIEVVRFSPELTAAKGPQEPAGAPQDAEAAGGHQDTGQAAGDAPVAPEAPELTYPCGHPIYPREGGWDAPPDCPRCFGPPDRSEERSGTVIAPSDWRH